MFFADKKEFNI